LFQTLLVADVRKNLIKNRDRATFSGRDVQSRLGHEGDQANGLERHRLAPGIGAGDDQEIEANAQTHINGDDLPLFDAGIVVRPVGGYGLGDCLRITVGNDAENARLLQALDEALA
jgi:hypothetical protein